ncbi:MAG: DUF1214 domain-containing protein [Hyphomonadaceae bacterium]|nr:DUF1214 domain-containing protein [Hyphomonadaceae bacterium]
MLRRIFAWLLAIVAGVILGGASAWATLKFGAASFTEHYGRWVHSRAAGSTAAGPYTRAIIARDGLLALSAREALYFSIYKDEQGRPLSESCIYNVAGLPLDARWWSLTLYADDNFLAQNTDNAHSIDASRLGNDRAWSARISPVRGDAASWVSSRAARRGFSLTLRVYNPQRDFHPDEASLPTLTTVSCAGDPS